MRTILFTFLLLFCLSCNKYSDTKEYCFISSTSEYREDEIIVNIEDSVFISRFILKAPYSHYNTLLGDSTLTEKQSETENNNPFLMLRFSVIDSLAGDIAISELNVHLFKLYDSIPGDEIPIHGIYTGNSKKFIQPSEIVGKTFSEKDTIRIKAGTTLPAIFMVTDYELKEHADDEAFLLRTQLTIRYKNAYNIVDMYDTIVRHQRNQE